MPREKLVYKMKAEGKVFINCKQATYLHTLKQEGKPYSVSGFGCICCIAVFAVCSLARWMHWKKPESIFRRQKALTCQQNQNNG
jgi:hypothetical protein